MSLEPPREMTEEKPTPFTLAQSRMAEQRAPDWDTKARLPGLADTWAKVALSLMAGRMRPRQLGPRIRTL